MNGQTLKLISAAALSWALITAAMAQTGSAAPGQELASAAKKKCKKKRPHKRRRCKNPQQKQDPGGGYVPPGLSISPTSHSFGNIVHNNYSSTFTFVITNTGGFSMHIEFHMVGTNASQFVFIPSSNTCIGSIPIGASCQLGIQFHPTTTGAKSATLNAVGLYDVTASAALTGRGT